MREIGHAARERASTFLVLALVCVTLVSLVPSVGARADSAAVSTLLDVSQVDGLRVSAAEL